MDAFFIDFSLSLNQTQVVIALMAFLLGGFSKGLIGFGMPLVVMSILSSAIPVEAALALNAVVQLVLNIGQTGGAAGAKESAKSFFPVLVGIVLGCLIGAFVVVAVERDLLVGFVGIVTLSFCLLSLSRAAYSIPESFRSAAGYLAGGASGLVGSMTGANGPPLIMYLTATRVGPQDFKRALGLLFLVSGISLFLVFSSVGFMTTERLIFGVVCLVPAAAGMWLGNHLTRKVNPELFRKSVLIVLTIIAVNLIRRGFF